LKKINQQIDNNTTNLDNLLDIYLKYDPSQEEKFIINDLKNDVNDYFDYKNINFTSTYNKLDFNKINISEPYNKKI